MTSVIYIKDDYCECSGCPKACTSVMILDPWNVKTAVLKPNRKDRRTYLKFLPKKVGTK